MEKDSLTPLLDCEGVLQESLTQTQSLLTQGRALRTPEEEGGAPHQPLTLTKDKINKFQRLAAANNWLVESDLISLNSYLGG